MGGECLTSFDLKGITFTISMLVPTVNGCLGRIAMYELNHQDGNVGRNAIVCVMVASYLTNVLNIASFSTHKVLCNTLCCQ